MKTTRFRGRRSWYALVAAVGLGLASGASAQMFQTAYGSPQDDRTEWIENTADGGMIIVGSRQANDGGTNVQMYIVKVDASGNLQWDRLIGGNGIEVAHRVMQTADGGYIVAGETSSSAPGFGLALVRLDPAGGLLWSFAYPGTPFAAGSAGAVGLDITDNGGFLLCGRLQGTPTASQAPVLIRTSPTGVLIWARAYQDSRFGAMTFASFADVHDLGQDRIAVCGFTSPSVVGDRDPLLVLMDTNGVPVFSKTYGHVNFTDWASGLEPAANGDFLLTGFAKIIGEGGGTHLLRVNGAGNVLWQKTFQFFSPSNWVEELPSTEIVLAGTTAQQGDNDAAMLLTDAAGVFQWSYRYGGDMTEFGEGVVQRPDTGFAVAGWSDSFGAGSFDMYLVKTDSTGRSGCNEEPYFPPLGDLQPPVVDIEMPSVVLDQFADLPVQVNEGTQVTPLCEPQDDPCIKPPLGMRAWWPLDEMAGTTSNEIVHLNHGSHVNGPSPTMGMVDGALCFNGVDQWVRVPDAPQLDFVADEDFSIDAWVRTSDASGVQIIVEKREQTAAELRGYSLFLSNGLLGLQLADGPGSFACSTAPSAACTNWVSSGFVADGEWHLVAVTIDRDDPNGLTFYVDGAPVGVFDPTPRLASLANNSELRIGARTISNTGVFDGCIDEVEIFGRELDPSEVMAIYNAGPAGKCKDTCHVPWDKPFCLNQNSIIVKVRVCNWNSTPQTYNLSFAGLPASTPGCAIAGPTVFTPIDPVPATIPPLTCQDIRVQIQRPAGMTSAFLVGCYEVTVTNQTSGGSIVCRGSVQDRRDLCAVVTPIDDVIAVPVGVSRPLTFGVSNDTADGISLPVVITSGPSDMSPIPSVISLNGLPAGEAVTQVIDLPPGGSGEITVQVSPQEHEPFVFYDIVLSTDVDGDGAPEPLVSAGVQIVAVDDTCPADWDGSGTVDSGDFFSFIADFLAGDADINGDTMTDSGDFFFFIQRFLDGC